MFKNLNPIDLGISGHQSEAIEAALTYKFNGLGLDMAELASRAKTHGLDYAKRLIASAGIQIGTFCLPIELVSDDGQFKSDIQELTELVKVAAEVGATRCITMIAPADDFRPYHENFEFHRERLVETCSVLETAGIRLGVGFRAAEDLRRDKAFQFIHDLEALTLLINMIGGPRIGMALDTWDLHVAGATPDTVRGLSSEQIVSVAVADLPEEDVAEGELTEACRRVPGTSGKVDVPAYLNALAEIGFDGPVTVKLGPDYSPGIKRDAAIKRVANALNEAWQAAGLTSTGTLAPTTEG